MKDYSFGNYICALRMGRGLSQFQLGTLVGVTDKAVSKWENGGAKPRVATCYRLAEVLGVSISELLSCEKPISLSARKEIEIMNRKLWEQAYHRLYEFYGEEPPVYCWSRLASEETVLKETDAIQSFAVLGKMAEKAGCQNSMIIPAGTINSSFTAWLLGATKVNPLPPHYRCPRCKRTEFVCGVRDGFDLEPKQCTCGAMFARDGHNIPHESLTVKKWEALYAAVRMPDSFRPTAAQVMREFYSGIAEVVPIEIEELVQGTLESYMILPGDSAAGAGGTACRRHDAQLRFDLIASDQLEALHRLQEKWGSPQPDYWEVISRELVERLYRRKCQKTQTIIDAIDPCEDHDVDLLTRFEGMTHGTGAWEGNGVRLVADGTAAFREIPAFREDIWCAVAMGLEKQGVRDLGLAAKVMEKGGKGKYFCGGIPENVEKLMQTLDLPPMVSAVFEACQVSVPKGALRGVHRGRYDWGVVSDELPGGNQRILIPVRLCP